MKREFSYKELLDKEIQNSIRARLLAVNKKMGLSIPRLASLIEINPKTMRKFLVDEEVVAYAVINRLVNWTEQQEVKLEIN